MSQDSPRVAREKRTFAAMVALYCRRHHRQRECLCADCQELLDYAFARLERCPHGEDKPACADCSIHCYKPALRQRVRQVMRCAGPRMLWRHPYLAIRHLLDARRKGKQGGEPDRERGGGNV